MFIVYIIQIYLMGYLSTIVDKGFDLIWNETALHNIKVRGSVSFHKT